ncbi:MAG: hypothetical protein K0S47_3150 [Herbinix sp.]|jgi:multidrug efflux pump subunit AcrA (membrane-fusion protein)|nr:hypothetical protein [Herbinix sp.]
MENKIKKIMIGFLGIMLLCTFISRAAASTLVAKVQVDKPKRGSLTYEVSGTGIVQAEAHDYIELMTGYKIGDVFVKKGQKVVEGDLLFQYDMDALKDKKVELEDDIKKLQLQYKEVGLTGENHPDTTDEEAALLAIETAKEDITQAKEAINEKKRTVKKNKKKDYEVAVSNLNDITASGKEAKQAADRAVEDAKNLVEKLEQAVAKLEEIFVNYTIAVETQNVTAMEEEYDNLFTYYYDGKYIEHKQQVKDTEKKLARAKEDLEDVQIKWNNIVLPQYLYDEEARNSYYEKIDQKKEELDNAQRAVDDAQEEYDHLVEVDHIITNTVKAYREAIETKFVEKEVYLEALRKIIRKKRAVDPLELTNAQTKLDRALEDQKEVTEVWESKKSAAEDKVNQLDQDLKNMEEGSYDYTEDLKEETKSLEQAKRLLNTANLQLEQARNRKEALNEQDRNQLEVNTIQKNILEIDIQKNQKEFEQLTKLMETMGKVFAPTAGIITEHNLTQGITLMGQEKMIITTGGYELSMVADKDEMQYFADGDEVTIKTGKGSTNISSWIENIEPSDENGKVNFTAILPEGEYQIGAGMEFRLSKDSEEFARCIPIQSLRQDMQGTFILLAREVDSVLGKVQEAFRMNVTVLSKDLRTAAVDAQLREEDMIITDSNRNISEGDRVRIYEME